MPTVEVDDEFRRRLNMYSGKPGLATRQEVRSSFEDNGYSWHPDLYIETDDRTGRATRVEMVREGGRLSPSGP